MQFSLEPLEYDELKVLLGRYATSQTARDLLKELVPSTDRESLRLRHELMREAMGYLRDRTIRFPDIPALPVVLDRLGPGGVTLEIAEIEAVQDFLSSIAGLRAQLAQDAQTFPLLAAEGRSLPDLGTLGRLLSNAIGGGEVREGFSPRLKQLRRELEASRGRLHRKLAAIVRSLSRAGQLQDDIVTLRNGRFVIPVRAEQQRSVQGVVHGTSSSGATVFMEPLETLEMNNDLVKTAEEEEREIRRILGELTERIQEQREALTAAAGIRAGLELLFGIARWARDFDCTTPRFSDGPLYLRKARHPLLEDRLRASKARVVPLDLDMASGERILVISGPNAGGKTVVLKTLGLFSLMAQSGIPVPADDAVLPLADRVLADIGDRQSISNQLSTFSAHVLEISRMVEAATRDSLILLDEIGSSTEPAEGAALGIAVLEHFRKAGARTVATTHYNRLKMYAETTDGVRNAAMEFDEETLTPTYSLIQGLAGQSSGLRIAERLRLRKDLIEVARSRLDQGEIEAARFVERLRKRIADLEEERRELEAERRQFEAWKKDMTARMDAERTSRLRDLEERLDTLVEDIRRRAEDSLGRVSPGPRRKFERTLDRARAEARETLRAEVRETGTVPLETGTVPEDKPGKPGAGPGPSASPVPGARVRIRSLGVEGAVLEITGGQAKLSVGSMKVQRPVGDLEVVSAPGAVRRPEVQFDVAPKEPGSYELNIIGCTADEAIERLDKFLDDAVLTGFPSVRIIHGSGKGVLRRSVAAFLEAHPHVEGFEAAPAGQGGAGVTVATLKD